MTAKDILIASGHGVDCPKCGYLKDEKCRLCKWRVAYADDTHCHMCLYCYSQFFVDRRLITT